MPRNNGWIQYKLVKPPAVGSQLIYCKNYGCSTSWWDGKNWWVNGEKLSETAVTHWQPLPFAPGEGL